MAKSPLDRKIHFEIHVCVDDRWTILSSSRERIRAIDEAKALLATRRFDAIKVTREGGPSKDEDVIFEETGKGRVEKKITINPVEEAPVCSDLEDFYGYEARKTINRLLRKYLDENAITATELLYSPGQIKWLSRNETLFNQAIQSIATLQARETGEKQHVRTDHLYTMVDKIIERAQEAEDVSKYHKLLKDKGLSSLVKKVEKSASEEDRDFLIHAALAEYIGGAQDWDRKLDLVIQQAETEPGVEEFAYLDEIIAEIVDGAAAINEVLGNQRNLGESLQTLVQLSAGSFKANRRSGPCLERLNAIRKRYDMPCTKGAMLERVEREIGGIKPLTKEFDEKTEAGAFKELMNVLVKSRAIAEGDGAISEAATQRAKSVFATEGVDQSSEKAIDDTISLLRTPAAKFGYLVDLSGTQFGEKNQSLIVSRLAAIVNNLKSATALVYAGADDIEVIKAAAGVRDRLMSTNLPEEWRLRFARKIYTLLVEFQAGAAPAGKKKSAEKEDAEDAAPVPNRRQTDKPVSDKHLTRKTFAAGEYVFREGDKGDEAYLIKKGRVEIARKSGGRDIVIAEVGVGSIIGEMALIDSKPRMATAKALTKTELTIIPKKDLKMRLDRLQKFDPVMRRLMGLMVERMRKNPIIDV